MSYSNLDNVIKEFGRRMIENAEEPNISNWLDRYINNKCVSPLFLPGGYPTKEFYVESDNLVNLDSKQDAKIRQIAQVMYMKFINTLISMFDKNDLNMLNWYRYDPNTADIKYTYAKFRKSSINDKLSENKQIIRASKYGKIVYEFNNRKDFPGSETWLMAYDDFLPGIRLFVEDNDCISRNEVLNIIRNKRNFMHELTHFIDDKLKLLHKVEYNQNDISAYLNDPDEIRAITQQLTVMLGTYIKKYIKNIDLEKLSDTTYIAELLEELLSTKNKGYHKNKDEIEITTALFNNMSEDTKKQIVNYLAEYLKDIYNTGKDINLYEGKLKARLLRLHNPEEYLKERV